MQSTSEGLLIRLNSADNADAWSRFVELYTPLVFYWARKTGLRSHDARDLVQDVLTVVFQKLPQFRYDRTRSFRGWLRKITLNKRLEQLRKKQLHVNQAPQSELDQDPCTESAESTWDRDYARQLVAGAMSLMSGEYLPRTWDALSQFLYAGRPAPRDRRRIWD